MARTFERYHSSAPARNKHLRALAALCVQAQSFGISSVNSFLFSCLLLQYNIFFFSYFLLMLLLLLYVLSYAARFVFCSVDSNIDPFGFESKRVSKRTAFALKCFLKYNLDRTVVANASPFSSILHLRFAFANDRPLSPVSSAVDLNLSICWYGDGDRIVRFFHWDLLLFRYCCIVVSWLVWWTHIFN